MSGAFGRKHKRFEKKFEINICISCKREIKVVKERGTKKRCLSLVFPTPILTDFACQFQNVSQSSKCLAGSSQR